MLKNWTEKIDLANITKPIATKATKFARHELVILIVCLLIGLGFILVASLVYIFYPRKKSKTLILNTPRKGEKQYLNDKRVSKSQKLAISKTSFSKTPEMDSKGVVDTAKKGAAKELGHKVQKIDPKNKTTSAMPESKLKHALKVELDQKVIKVSETQIDEVSSPQSPKLSPQEVLTSTKIENMEGAKPERVKVQKHEPEKKQTSHFTTETFQNAYSGPKSSLSINKGTAELISLFGGTKSNSLEVVPSNVLYSPPSNIEETRAKDALASASTTALSSQEDL